MKFDNAAWFRRGIQNGVPIALGYLAVSFTLGIAARNAGLTAWQGAAASVTTVASAGEYAGFNVIQAGAGYIEMAIMMFVINARYLLMSCSLSQKLAPDLPLVHRLLIGWGITDEIFGVASVVPDKLNPWYNYGMMAISIPAWTIGTAVGIAVGTTLSVHSVSVCTACFWLLSSRPDAKTRSSPVWLPSRWRPVSPCRSYRSYRTFHPACAPLF